MPLNLKTGTFVPFVKYNAKTGRWAARFGEDKHEIEFANPRLVFGFDTIQTGWILFGTTGAPQTLWDPALTVEAPRPDWDKVKRGFRVLVMGNDALKEARGQKLGVRELMSNATAMTVSLSAVYEQYEQGRAANPGCLPFVKNTEVNKRTGNFGAVYEPVFQIVSWVPMSKLDALKEAVAADHGVDEPPPEPEGAEDDGIPYENDDDRDIPF